MTVNSHCKRSQAHMRLRNNKYILDATTAPSQLATGARRSESGRSDAQRSASVHGRITSKGMAVTRSKRTRAQQRVAALPSDGSVQSCSPGEDSNGRCSRAEAPAAKRTRRACAAACSHAATATSSSSKTRGSCRHSEDNTALPVLDDAAASREDIRLYRRALQWSADIVKYPHRLQHFPEVLAAMLRWPDDEDFQVRMLNAAFAVEKTDTDNMMEAFLENHDLLRHLLNLVSRSQISFRDTGLHTAAHMVICLVACRAVNKSSDAAAAILQLLLEQDHRGLKHMLQEAAGNNKETSHGAMAVITSMAATPRFIAREAAVASVVQPLYATAMQQHNGLQLLLAALQEPHVRGLAALALESFAHVIPQQLLDNLLSAQQRRGLQFLLAAANSSSKDVSSPAREAIFLMIDAAAAPKLQQLLQHLLRAAQRQYSVAAMQLIVLASMQAGPAVLNPHAHHLLQLLQQPQGSQNFKHLIIRALQHLSQTDAGQQVLIARGIRPLLYAMSNCEPETAVAAASLVCMLAGSADGRAALIPHIRGLLQVAAQRRRADISGIAVQCVGAILVFGSVGPQGNLLLNPVSPGLTEIVNSIDVILGIMQYDPAATTQQQQDVVDQPLLEVQVDQQQQHDPQAGAEQQPPQQQQQEPGMLQIRPCAAVSAAMIINAVAVAPQGLHVLQQEHCLDLLLSVVQHRGPAATLAARAVSQVVAAAPDSRQLLLAAHRLAVVNALQADVSRIRELGSVAARSGPAALAAAALAAMNGDYQDAAADVFRAAGPLIHLLAACASCGVVPEYVDSLARILHTVPCLTMLIFEAFMHLITFRDGVLALAPHIQYIAAAVHCSLRQQSMSPEAAAAAGAVSMAAIRGSFDELAAANALRQVTRAVQVVTQQLQQEQAHVQSCMQHAAVQLAQAVKQYRRWPRTKKLQAAAVLWSMHFSKASERNRALKQQLWHIKFSRQARGYKSIRDEVRAIMGV